MIKHIEAYAKPNVARRISVHEPWQYQKSKDIQNSNSIFSAKKRVKFKFKEIIEYSKFKFNFSAKKRAKLTLSSFFLSLCCSLQCLLLHASCSCMLQSRLFFTSKAWVRFRGAFKNSKKMENLSCFYKILDLLTKMVIHQSSYQTKLFYWLFTCHCSLIN